MSNDADDDEVSPAGSTYDSGDPIADRADAFGILAQRLDTIRDPRVVALGLDMLTRIALSVKKPRGQLIAIPHAEV